jgi:hypothetical protein
VAALRPVEILTAKLCKENFNVLQVNIVRFSENQCSVSGIMCLWTVASSGLLSCQASTKRNYRRVRARSRTRTRRLMVMTGKGGRDKPRAGNPSTRYEGLQGMGQCTVQLSVRHLSRYRLQGGRVGFSSTFSCLNCSKWEERVS